MLDESIYREKAREFIMKRGLAFPNMSDSIEISGFEKMEAENEDGSVTERITIIGATFKHTDLEGIEIDGVGPKLTVLFDDSGEVIGVMSVWRTFEPYKKYLLATLEQALEQIRNRNAVIYGALPGDKGIIDDVKIVYYNPPLKKDAKS